MDDYAAMLQKMHDRILSEASELEHAEIAAAGYLDVIQLGSYYIVKHEDERLQICGSNKEAEQAVRMARMKQKLTEKRNGT